MSTRLFLTDEEIADRIFDYTPAADADPFAPIFPGHIEKATAARSSSPPPTGSAPCASARAAEVQR
jgi:hypothetical protein